MDKHNMDRNRVMPRRLEETEWFTGIWAWMLTLVQVLAFLKEKI